MGNSLIAERKYDRLQQGFYKETEPIRFFHCDPLLRLKLSCLNGFLAEIASTDYEIKGHGREDLLNRDVLFLLSRVSIQINRMPRYGDRLTLTTWEDQVKGALCIRNFEGEDQNGTLCFSSESAWMVVNPKTRQIRRPNSVDGIYQPSYLPSQAPSCEKLRFLGGNFIGERIVQYSDLDGNGHTYNAKYSDFAMDVLPDVLRQKELRQFQINFNHEALLGDSVSLFLWQEGDRAMVKGETNGKDCFVCSFLFE